MFFAILSGQFDYLLPFIATGSVGLCLGSGRSAGTVDFLVSFTGFFFFIVGLYPQTRHPRRLRYRTHYRPPPDAQPHPCE